MSRRDNGLGLTSYVEERTHNTSVLFLIKLGQLAEETQYKELVFWGEISREMPKKPHTAQVLFLIKLRQLEEIQRTWFYLEETTHSTYSSSSNQGSLSRRHTAQIQLEETQRTPGRKWGTRPWVTSCLGGGRNHKDLIWQRLLIFFRTISSSASIQEKGGNIAKGRGKKQTKVRFLLKWEQSDSDCSQRDV